MELADAAGIDYVWEVEHHFLEEYSHSSAPEVFLAAASQRTKRIRLGHGIVQLPPAFNHPARVAERIATLDLVSGGRVEFGTGESSSAAELGGFGVDRASRSAPVGGDARRGHRMFVEEPFAGYDGKYLTMPPRNVVPKPMQKPHPPLWVACSRRETIHLAARSGIGALSFSFVEPEDAKEWVDEYYDLIASDECVPRGFAVNPNVAVVLPMMLHPDEQTAIERGIDGAHFFGYSLAPLLRVRHARGRAAPTCGRASARTGPSRASPARSCPRRPRRSAVRLLQAGLGSLRGAIGTPAQVTDLIAALRDGRGRPGDLRHAGGHEPRTSTSARASSCSAREVLPRFADGREKAEAAKADRLADAIETALARREGPRALAAPYPINEEAELAAARSAGHAPLRELAGQAAHSAGESVRGSVQSGVRQLVGRASDSAVERLFGSRRAQRGVFSRIAGRFDPARAGGFEGVIRYDLGLSDGSRRPWDIEVRDGLASVAPAGTGAPVLTIRVPLVDFIRVITDGESFLPLITAGTMTLDGDLGVAGRLAEMFGARSGY